MTVDIAKLRALLDAADGPFVDMGDAAFAARDARLLVALRNAAPGLLDELELFRTYKPYIDALTECMQMRVDVERLRRLEAADLAFYALIERQDAGEEVTPDEWVAAMKVQRACQVEASDAARSKAGG